MFVCFATSVVSIVINALKDVHFLVPRACKYWQNVLYRCYYEPSDGESILDYSGGLDIIIRILKANNYS